ncbi:MAG: type I restriction endonuclease subunit R [bacterium]|nr:type I restriction endonuclease subunit R [bacterium]
MTTQPEAILEANLVQQLKGLGYAHASVQDEASLLANLKAQLEAFNGLQLTPREFTQVVNYLSKGNVLVKAKALRDRFQLTKEDGESVYIRFFDAEKWGNNRFQVTSQVTVEGIYRNRYDVTLLVNGLPLVQIELKKRGLELKEAFNQINRYQRHSYGASVGLFQYIQIFVISNGVNTKYYANNRKQSFKQTFFWAEESNRTITELAPFAEAFLNPDHVGKMIAHYVVVNETLKILMVLRPYQYYATEAIINQVREQKGNGYIWHTTGSGKTLTSFKAAQILMGLPQVHKVIFVVDRKDLDDQTMQEFNAFQKDSVDTTNATKQLVAQFCNDTRLILTTIQKLNRAIGPGRFEQDMAPLADKNLVFIFDECHRSQFGATHQRITGFFKKAQLFGFTGTPIFADNAIQNDRGKRTTADLFGDRLHKYLITDAIGDENVLRFSVEYIGRYKRRGEDHSGEEVDIEVEAVDTKEVIDAPERKQKIVDYIAEHHGQKTHNKAYSAIFAISSIPNLIDYYRLFMERPEVKKGDLRIATIFTYGANEEDEEANGMLEGEAEWAEEDAEDTPKAQHSREALDQFIAHYNAQFGTGFSTKDSKSFEAYFKSIAKRLKDREKEGQPAKDRLDILLVVNMFLTGFDAKKLNTLYVDKNLKHHGLIQAFSRTNRVLNEQKSQGNILCFRNLKAATDEAIALFSDKDAKEHIFLPPYKELVRQFGGAFGKLLSIAPSVEAVDDLKSEEDQLEFIKAFRELMRLRNVLISFTEFTWADLPMTQQAFEDYKSKYLDLYEHSKSDHVKEKESILTEVDFELELIHKDEINVAYILRLLAKLKEAETKDQAQQKKQIIDLLSGNVGLRSKRELIEKFIDQHLPKIEDSEAIGDEFIKYWQDQKTLALGRICEEEGLDREQFSRLIESYIYNSQEPLREEVFKCLGDRPSVLQARAVGERILAKMKEFVEVFVRGMVA